MKFEVEWNEKISWYLQPALNHERLAKKTPRFGNLKVIVQNCFSTKLLMSHDNSLFPVARLFPFDKRMKIVER